MTTDFHRHFHTALGIPLAADAASFLVAVSQNAAKTCPGSKPRQRAYASAASCGSPVDRKCCPSLYCACAWTPRSLGLAVAAAAAAALRRADVACWPRPSLRRAEAAVGSGWRERGKRIGGVSLCFGVSRERDFTRCSWFSSSLSFMRHRTEWNFWTLRARGHTGFAVVVCTPPSGLH